MEVSKLQLSSAMMEAMARPGITRKQKTKLRQQAVKDYIRSKPSGTPITTQDLIDVARYTRAAGYQALNKWVKKGVIRKTPVPGSFGFEWSIPGDMTTTKEPKPTPAQEVTSPELTPATNEVKNIELIIQVENLARDFSWKSNSDSLREFVKSLK